MNGGPGFVLKKAWPSLAFWEVWPSPGSACGLLVLWSLGPFVPVLFRWPWPGPPGLGPCPPGPLAYCYILLVVFWLVS